jgi:hypothetical protein
MAVKKGRTEIVEWSLAQDCVFGPFVCACAAHVGNLELLRRLRARGCPWNSSTVGCAREAGHMELAQWALENGCPNPIDEGPEDFEVGERLLDPEVEQPMTDEEMVAR